MPFLPDTPITIAYAVALLLVSAIALRFDARLWPALLVMWVNWLATRAVTAFDAPAYLAGLADIACALALVALWHLRAMAVLPVAALFALMVFCYGLHDLNLVKREAMWAIVDVFGYLQLVFILAAAHGGGRRVGLGFMAPAAGGRDRVVAGAVANRVQASPPP